PFNTEMSVDDPVATALGSDTGAGVVSVPRAVATGSRGYYGCNHAVLCAADRRPLTEKSVDDPVATAPGTDTGAGVVSVPRAVATGSKSDWGCNHALFWAEDR